MKLATLCGAMCLAISTLVFVTEASASEKIESSSDGQRITIDGNSTDWEGIPLVYLEKSLRVLGVTHDDDNLYLMFRFSDEHLARRLLTHGVTLWINGDGKRQKKHEEFAVRYPGSTQIAEQLEGEPPPDRRARTETGPSNGPGHRGPPPRIAGMVQVPGRLTVIRMGVKETIDGQDAPGPIAASTFDDGLFCYELKIPFTDIGGKIADASPAKVRKVAIGVQIGGMTEAEMEMMQSTAREGMGGMGGGPGGGGMSGPGGGGMAGPSGGIGGPGGGPVGGGPGGGGMGRPGGDRRDRMNPEIEWLSVTLKPRE